MIVELDDEKDILELETVNGLVRLDEEKITDEVGEMLVKLDERNSMFEGGFAMTVGTMLDIF